jgi:oligopeptide/dipeptide ABC transporter ATP-binding protein
MAELATGTSLLAVRDVKRHFRSGGGLFGGPVRVVRAVDGLTLDVRAGETLGIVGESGSGKTTLARMIVGLTQPTAGEIWLSGRRLDWSARDARRNRRDVQLVFQDPMGSLDPRWTVESLVREPLEVFQVGSRAERQARVASVLERVGLDRGQWLKRPAELSGGQRQRVGIARAIVLRPRLVVCDEPVSALDVSIRGQILELLAELRRDLGLTYLYISHDLGTVRRVADRVLTMYLGRVVELAPVQPYFTRPLHPYTQALLSAVPLADLDRELHRRRVVLAGEVADASRVPPGCRFHPRCPLAQQICREVEPELREAIPGREARCHFAPDAIIRPEGAQPGLQVA